jgi:hypothetical protein
MKRWITRFNSYLLVVTLGGLMHVGAAPASAGKSTSGNPQTAKTNAPSAKPGDAAKKPDKKNRHELSTFKAHIEIFNDGGQWCRQIQVDRQYPITLTVDRTPVLEEEHLEKADVVDVIGGFALRIKLNERGTMLLDTASSSYRGQRLAIFSSFGQNRWLGAPLLSQRIRDGVITFTPDATREEAERIANGLNNQAAKIKKNSSF